MAKHLTLNSICLDQDDAMHPRNMQAVKTEVLSLVLENGGGKGRQWELPWQVILSFLSVNIK